MVAYLRLLPFLGLLLPDCNIVSAQGPHGLANGKQDWTKGGDLSYVPGAYIVEYEDGHVGTFASMHYFNRLPKCHVLVSG